jgi:surface antigen
MARREALRTIPARRVLVAGVLALWSAGCSMSFPMTSLVAEEPTETASIAPKIISPLSSELGAEDWRRAKAAMATALDPQGNGSQVSWDNPESTMKGSFTPVGQPFVKNDEICRAFLAHVTGQMSNASLQGTACRPSGGEWAIKDVRPFKKT